MITTNIFQTTNYNHEFANHNRKSATVKLPGLGVTLQPGENDSGEGHDDDD